MWHDIHFHCCVLICKPEQAVELSAKKVRPCKCGNQRGHYNVHYVKGKGLTSKGLKTLLSALIGILNISPLHVFCREDLSVLVSYLRDLLKILRAASNSNDSALVLLMVLT